jgi:hypothetical protein
MTLDEKLAISNKALALWRAGDNDGYKNMMKKMPIPPYLAKILKEKVGAEIIRIGGWDLSEVEAEFGTDWLNS